MPLPIAFSTGVQASLLEAAAVDLDCAFLFIGVARQIPANANAVMSITITFFIP